MKPAPYPPDTRAKGWRFELNMEQFRQSDTWLRARTSVTRGLLLLLWGEAWMQTPCGSLPDDRELIALMLGMDEAEFAPYADVLLRGWWRADDGRLYHDTITERVIGMMGKRRSDSDRQNARRARTPSDVPGESRVTPVGIIPESITGTGTGTSNTPTPPIGGGHPPLPPADLLDLGDPPPPAPPPPAKKPRKAAPPVDVVEGVDAEVIAAWRQVRAKKRAGPINDIVLKAVDREAAKAGLTRQQAIVVCVERGWQGFTAEWYLKDQPARMNGATSHTGLSSRNYHEGLDEHGHIR